MVAQLFGFLPPLWNTWIALPAPSFSDVGNELANVNLLGLGLDLKSISAVVTHPV